MKAVHRSALGDAQYQIKLNALLLDVPRNVGGH
jgi:hypothetical protein